MSFQRLIQTFTLGLYLVLLLLASFPLIPHLPVELFLRLDPIALLDPSISSRTIILELWPALAIILLTPLLGRFFCGYLCPMGTTIDVTDSLLKPKGKETQELAPSLAHLKYYILFFILGSALTGVSFSFLASPLSLITRLYGLVLHPVAMVVADGALGIARPLFDLLDLRSLAHLKVSTPRFATQLFIVGLFIGIFSLARVSPRFFCRYLCPSGALLRLASLKPVIRRRVSEECIDCGLCQKSCPMSAIPSDPRKTEHGLCVVCETCVKICPVNAVSFDLSAQPFVKTKEFLPERRKLLASGAGGLFTGIITLTGLSYPRKGPGNLIHPALIRPPGSLPEEEFLARCIRCGECMKACPTNTLQPIWFIAGLSGLFSPKVTPRVGGCEPSCNVCGSVCPTGAIRGLEARERIWAKIGTAQILKHKCLAWEFGKKCLICDEVCQYNAVEFKKVPGISVPVPFVEERRCSGCGFCEHFCPVQAQPAILVEPMGEIRLSSGSYLEKGKGQGLSLEIRPKGYGPQKSLPEDKEFLKAPPGFTE